VSWAKGQKEQKGDNKKMKVYITYTKDMQGWKRNHLDTDLMLYEGDVMLDAEFSLPEGMTLLRQVKNLQELGYLIETQKAIYVLREPMELNGDQVEYDAVEFNIDYIINSSKILFVEPVRYKKMEKVPPSTHKWPTNVGRPR